MISWQQWNLTPCTSCTVVRYNTHTCNTCAYNAHTCGDVVHAPSLRNSYHAIVSKNAPLYMYSYTCMYMYMYLSQWWTIKILMLHIQCFPQHTGHWLHPNTGMHSQYAFDWLGRTIQPHHWLTCMYMYTGIGWHACTCTLALVDMHVHVNLHWLTCMYMYTCIMGCAVR